MSIYGANIGISGRSTVSGSCSNVWGCGTNDSYDFCIKRHDTKPEFKVSIEDCDGPFDLSDESLVAEVNMWAEGKLRRAIEKDDTYFQLADNIGFDQIMIGDIIVMEQVRAPEHMLVTNFDEANYYVQVQRAYNGTLSRSWPKGTGIKIFRIMSAPAEIEMVYEDVVQVDGTTAKNQLMQSFLVYEWSDNDTCLPGCYWLEFKLLKMLLAGNATIRMQQSEVVPSWTPTVDYKCDKGSGIEWVRRFPYNKKGFFVNVIDSPTSEM
jgi:hypothetical protein